MIRSLIAALLLVASASAASALCTDPSLGPKDTVFQFGSAGTTESVGAIGTGDKLNTRRAGSLYYDYNAGTLKLCNGTSWQPIEFVGGNYVAGSFAQWSVWRKDLASQATARTPDTVPLEPTGTYKVMFNVEGSSNQCDWYFFNSSNIKYLMIRKGNTGSDRFLQASFTFYGRGAGKYSYALEGYGTDEANNGGTTNMHMDKGEQGTLNWNGRVVLEPSSCKGFISVLRVQ